MKPPRFLPGSYPRALGQLRLRHREADTAVASAKMSWDAAETAEGGKEVLGEVQPHLASRDDATRGVSNLLAWAASAAMEPVDGEPVLERVPYTGALIDLGHA